MSRVAALTGGTGFLGGHVARAFCESGWRVRMLTRRAAPPDAIADLPLEPVPGDLSDEDALQRLCAGADAVIHMAGLVKAADEADFMAVNADGAAALTRAWRAAAPEARFTLVSSMAARAPHLSPYAASKRAGEAALGGVDGDWRILRPSAIYGAHDDESLKVLKLANLPVQPMLNAPEARVSMIDARDAAGAIVALAAHPGGGALHELTDARRDGYPWRELVETAARALGRAPRPVRAPAPVIRAAGAVGERLARLTGSAEMLTRGKAREILHPDWSAETEPPPPDIWRPRIALEDGLRHMAAWARETGRL